MKVTVEVDVDEDEIFEARFKAELERQAQTLAGNMRSSMERDMVKYDHVRDDISRSFRSLEALNRVIEYNGGTAVRF